MLGILTPIMIYPLKKKPMNVSVKKKNKFQKLIYICKYILTKGWPDDERIITGNRRERRKTILKYKKNGVKFVRKKIF